MSLGAILKSSRLAIKHKEESHQYSARNSYGRKNYDTVFQIFEASNKLNQTKAAINTRPSSATDEVDSDPQSTNLHMKGHVFFWEKI